MWKLFGYALLFALMAVAGTPAQAQITGSNWSGLFYNDTFLTTPAASENYPNGLYFNWGPGHPLKADNATPVPGISADNFSITFTSTQTFAQGGTYRFTTYVDDGVRVFIDDELVLNEFNPNETNTYRTFVFHRNITAGAELDIRVDYVEHTGNAILVFQWGIVPTPASIPIIAPLDGSTFTNNLTPVFTWQHIGALSYVFKLWPVGGTTLLQAAYPAAAICTESVCTLDTGALPRRAALALKNGLYEWRVKTQGLPVTHRSKISEFIVYYPGMPLSLTPDFGTSVAGPSPLLKWGDVALADQYKVVLTRVKTGKRIKTGWMLDVTLGCDAIWCTLDLAALEPPVLLRRGRYTWQVFARTIAYKSNITKSPAASFKVVPAARTSPLPPPAAAEGFRAP
jgi:hypothetical protein